MEFSDRQIVTDSCLHTATAQNYHNKPNSLQTCGSWSARSPPGDKYREAKEQGSALFQMATIENPKTNNHNLSATPGWPSGQTPQHTTPTSQFWSPGDSGSE